MIKRFTYTKTKQKKNQKQKPKTKKKETFFTQQMLLKLAFVTIVPIYVFTKKKTKKTIQKPSKKPYIHNVFLLVCVFLVYLFYACFFISLRRRYDC